MSAELQAFQPQALTCPAAYRTSEAVSQGARSSPSNTSMNTIIPVACSAASRVSISKWSYREGLSKPWRFLGISLPYSSLQFIRPTWKECPWGTPAPLLPPLCAHLILSTCHSAVCLGVWTLQSASLVDIVLLPFSLLWLPGREGRMSTQRSPYVIKDMGVPRLWSRSPRALVLHAGPRCWLEKGHCSPMDADGVFARIKA